MRTSNKTIMVVLGVGAVLALAGQVMAQSGYSRGRDGFRGGSDSRGGFRGGSDSRAPFIHRGFTGGFSVGYAESPRYYAAPRIVASPYVVAPWWLGYGSTVYVAPPCGLTGRVFVAPQCSVRRPVFVAPFFPHHRYEQPTWRHDWR
jgi:hypothetical protein